MRSAFTLIELLIVVVILAILAAVMTPFFVDATGDSKMGAAVTNLWTIREQLQLYKAQHQGLPPDPALSNLLRKTDINGNAGGNFGPYLYAIPLNPLTNKNTVNPTSSNPPATATSGSDRGWLYHAASGNIWLDEPGYLDK
jgi:general secretion pathway protein G